MTRLVPELCPAPDGRLRIARMKAMSALPDLSWLRECVRCHKTRSVELFDRGADTCALCIRKEERTAAGMLNKSQRQVDARQRQMDSAADRYRRQLEAAGYTSVEIERYVRRRFREMA